MLVTSSSASRCGWIPVRLLTATQNHPEDRAALSWRDSVAIGPPDDDNDMNERKIPTFLLALAVILDVVGLILFLVGIFAPLSFWDFFVLSGPLLIFLSLIFWIFWYLGNLTVSEEELNLVKTDVL